MNVDPTSAASTEPVREWVAPEVVCYETRPEVTAYAGDGAPWNNR